MVTQMIQMCRVRHAEVTQMGMDVLQLHRLPTRCHLTTKRGQPILGTHAARDQVQTQAQQQQPQEKRDLIRSLPPVRPAAPPPEAVAVQHSSSFIYRQRREELGIDADAAMPSYPSSERSWREDARDVNVTAASGIANAAKATANVSGKVLSVAVPVGGWALRQGFKAAKGALKRNSAKQPGSSQRRRKSGDEDE